MNATCRLILLVVALAATFATAQTLTVLHNFTGGSDGAYPSGRVIVDQNGNVYGSATSGGTGYGTIFKLNQRSGNYTFATLYEFGGGSDGAGPVSGLNMASNGVLYGTTAAGQGGDCSTSGGTQNGCGTIFYLQPPATFCHSVTCPDTKTTIYSFTGQSDGSDPYGDLTFDSQGNIYGTTRYGGATKCGLDAAGTASFGCGTAYELSSSQDGIWTEAVIYSFGTGTNDGIEPLSVVTLDNGDLYGTTFAGGANSSGRVFQLTTSGVETAIYDFVKTNNFPSLPQAGVIFDSSGQHLFGATSSGSELGGGTVFELTSGTYSPIQEFTGTGFFVPGPHNTLSIDGSGNLYGTTFNGGANGLGSIFELAPSGDSFTYHDLYDFDGTHGEFPIGSLAIDSSGNLYGTTYNGGSGSCVGGCGVAFKLVR